MNQGPKLRAWRTKDWKGKVSYLLSRIKGRHKNEGGRVVDESMTIEHLLEMLKSQDFKCAISGIALSHQMHDLRSLSIDRIDCSKGYSLENIQLVCKGINLMRNDHTVEETKRFLAELSLKSPVIPRGETGLSNETTLLPSSPVV